ncbi:MAG TPA: hypothetical protein VHP36_09985 [Chitinispirillaceae bacterium]|nr:hypothetical protein [Chitinispirillaceae bacterium]
MRIQAVFAVVACLLLNLHAADDIDINDLGANIRLPNFSAKLSIGFNYDFLRDPTSVSFEYPRGYFGFNIPISHSVNLRDFIQYADPAIDSIFSDSTIISNGDEFKPEGSAGQNPNLTIQVDVPMLGGVASFSNTQNFSLNYSNALGNPNVYIKPDSLIDGINFLMRGTISVPLSMSMSWETMTFGYAYRINRYLTMALNLHRHTFVMDLRGKIDADLLGRLNYASDDGSIEIERELDYPSSKVYGHALGHYEAEVWSPTLGLKAWRFSLVSRFGLSTRAKGSFSAKYSVPFFIDPETFQTKYDFEDPDLFSDDEFINKLTSNAIDSVSYTTKDMNGNEPGLHWKMPTGLTISFDLLPGYFTLSYTKIFGDIEFKLDKIRKEQRTIVAGNSGTSESDSLIIDFGTSVDHIIMLQCNVYKAFLNIGVFGIDFRYGEQTHLLGSKMPYMHMGESAMIPVVNFGSTIGSKMQLHLELDVLPLPALKTGIVYKF